MKTATASIQAFFLSLGLAAPAAWAGKTNLTLLLVCDTYIMGAQEGRGGYPKIAAVAAAERAKNPNMLFVHAGDAYSPTLMSGFDQGDNVVDLLNLLKPDIFVPGNHEYDFGPNVFRKLVRESRFPVLAANLTEPGGAPVAGVEKSRIVVFGEVKLGVVGLTAQDSPRKSTPGDLRFDDVVQSLEREAAALRAKGADLIVAVAHADREIDNKIIESRAADILLSGDDHDLWLTWDGRTVGVEAKQDGEVLVAIDLSVDVRAGEPRKVAWHPNFRIIDTLAVEPDAALARRVAEYELTLAKELDVALAVTRTAFDSRSITVRGGEAAIGNLFADAVRSVAGADVALLNGGSFRAAKAYAAGAEITRRDVLSELPFGNKTLVLDMTGAELRRALEYGFADLEKISGRFPQVSGLTLVVEREAPSGRRLSSIRVGGEPLDDARRYKVATNDFLYHGGDGYTMLGKARLLVDERSAKLIANDVMVYLRAQGEVAPAVSGRITVR
jgi:2',3'-cyclic-nucleotide 2'-phosphodiesterase (5'-nucleotidase family)